MTSAGERQRRVQGVTVAIVVAGEVDHVIDRRAGTAKSRRVFAAIPGIDRVAARAQPGESGASLDGEGAATTRSPSEPIDRRR